MTISPTSSPDAQATHLNLSRIEIRFAQLAFLYPQHADDRLTLASIYGDITGNDQDEWLERMCQMQFDFEDFRQTLLLLLEDMAFRGAVPSAAIMYSLIRETGCPPELKWS